jgi:hypothetical protein
MLKCGRKMKRKSIEKAEKGGKIYVLEHLFLLEGVVRMCVYCKIIIPKLTKRVLNCVSKTNAKTKSLVRAVLILCIVVHLACVFLKT